MRVSSNSNEVSSLKPVTYSKTIVSPSAKKELKWNSTVDDDYLDNDDFDDDDTHSLRSAISSSHNIDDVENVYFAKSESSRVAKLKLVVFLILFLVAVGVCAAVFLVTSNGQEGEFKAAFEGNAAKVFQKAEEVFAERVRGLTALSVSITLYVLQNELEWPFVRIENFNEIAASARKLSGAMGIQLLPVVDQQNVLQYLNFSLGEASGWLEEAWNYQRDIGIPDELNPPIVPSLIPILFSLDDDYNLINDPTKASYYPIWQSSPVLSGSLTNYDGEYDHASTIQQVRSSGSVVVNKLTAIDRNQLTNAKEQALAGYFDQFLSMRERMAVQYTGEPINEVFVPILNSFSADTGRNVTAILIAQYIWAEVFENVFPDDDTKPVQVVIKDCDGVYTYTIDGSNVFYDGQGEQIDPTLRDMVISNTLNTSQVILEDETLRAGLQQACPLQFDVFPSQEAKDEYVDNYPLMITMIVASAFFFTVLVFVLYDFMVERRQRRVLDTAKRSTAIVSSIYPKKVRDQLMKAPVQGNATKLRSLIHNPRSAHVQNDNTEGSFGSKPIADLFPECTVMFADVEGFTSWSSAREPSMVFTLLETLYNSFDNIAARRKVFKVETIGDCYLAACGVPDPNKDHAITMARYAQDCIDKHIEKVRKLEVLLGPDTGDLRLRIGLNSGPVTAGVLRGERARFQLFGDTVNVGSRIETSGEGNRIHVSGTTAALIRRGGFDSWLTKRDGCVELKGKGKMETYWLKPTRSKLLPSTYSESSEDIESSKSQKGLDGQNGPKFSKRKLCENRMVAWNSEVLVRMLKEIIARRNEDSHGSESHSFTQNAWSPEATSPLEEVKEIIELPDKSSTTHRNPESIIIPTEVIHLIKDYVSCLAELYQNNPFHNFEHASHVTMSVAKLLSRIVAPSDMDFTDGQDATKHLHDHTYGITSDPLTQFGCVLAALIHDADHQGVPNTTLTLEASPLVEMYGGKSLAEQNSVDLAWELLMEDRFQPLVSIICKDNEELARLRQLVVNAVMATDIMDPDLKKLRNDRWDKAFHTCNDEGTRDAINRKATIVIEHLLQASDVSHTMQHWNIYTKWNARLFKEMYKAYLDGRGGAKNPADFWAKGEIGFFDFYIIPLAKKLKECGVFGVSSDEYLNYAQANRDEWERKGEMLVQKLVQDVQTEYGIKE